WAGRSIMPVDELVPTPADPDRRFSARLAAALPGELRRRLIPIEVEGDPQLRAIALDARLRAEGLAAVVLGLGPDGHVAFNQPATPLDAPARVVDLAPGNLARLGPVEPARSALTLGVTTILAAGAVLPQPLRPPTPDSPARHEGVTGPFHVLDQGRPPGALGIHLLVAQDLGEHGLDAPPVGVELTEAPTETDHRVGDLRPAPGIGK